MTITAGDPRTDAPRAVRLRQVPGLDGLRAVAVVAVIVYHLNPSWLPGGYLGVDIFFVISGYLITALLLSEFRSSSDISLRRFWGRRARRLLPALGVVLFAVTVLAAGFARDGLQSLQQDVPASVFYILNWVLLFGHHSYVASFGRPPLLQHLWSLSVEEQFYLLWPPAVVLLLRRRATREHIAAVALGGAAASALLMAVLYRHGHASSVYFGTHTHAEGLLIGCALAAAVPPWRMTAHVAPRARRILERSGVVAMGLVVTGLVTLGFNSSFTYRGGMLLVDLATAVVVATVAHPASRLGAGLARQPLRWLGLRSYSLYLWHWPIFEMTRPGPDLAWSTVPDVLLRLSLTAAAAELTYRYVEQPWRYGRAQFAWRVRLASLARWQIATAALTPIVLIALLLTTAPAPSEPPILATGSTPAARSIPVTPPTLVVSAPPPLIALPPPTTTPSTTTASTTTAPPSPAALIAASEPVLAFGDSVMLAVAPTLSAAFGPAITVDAAVGRQVDAGVARMAAYRAYGVLGRYKSVVVALGTNGAWSPALFNQIAAIVAGIPHVVVVNVHGRLPWAAPDNTVLAQGVAAHRPQMKLVDWNVAAFAPGVLYPDEIHPNAAGSAIYVHLIQRALSTPAS